LPREHGAHDEQGVGGGARRREFGNAAEDDGEYDGGEERPDDSPGDADDGLFVSDKDVAPGEEVEQLAVAPEVAPVVLLGAAGFYEEFDGDRS
jgi:hypothetical protein